jgi:hypothetical protein
MVGVTVSVKLFSFVPPALQAAPDTPVTEYGPPGPVNVKSEAWIVLQRTFSLKLNVTVFPPQAGVPIDASEGATLSNIVAVDPEKLMLYPEVVELKLLTLITYV